MFVDFIALMYCHYDFQQILFKDCGVKFLFKNIQCVDIKLLLNDIKECSEDD